MTSSTRNPRRLLLVALVGFVCGALYAQSASAEPSNGNYKCNKPSECAAGTNRCEVNCGPQGCVCYTS